MKKENRSKELTLGFRAFRGYVWFYVKDIFYKDIQFLNTENIPEDGTPLLVVSNHQNALNDALSVMFSMVERKVRFIVRADVFKIHPIFTKIFRWLGLSPAYRLEYEGENALKNNDGTFKESETNLLNGKTVTIYPEAGHQDKHWLGTFSYGYTRMAFQAAEMGNFEREIFILPSCNHYSKYTGLRGKTLVKYGTPISLKPYYELYKTKPRTAQRQVNALVREQIHSMMLSIDDLDNYYEIDYIRQSEFGQKFAASKGLNPEELPKKLEADKLLVEKLAQVPEEQKQPIYDDVRVLRKGMAELKLTESQFSTVPKWLNVVASLVALVLLAPLSIVAIWPSVLSWFIPEYFSKKVGDVMLKSSFLIGINMLIIIPICSIVTLVVLWVKFSFVLALLGMVALPFLCLFEWYYCKAAEKMYRDLQYLKKGNRERVMTLSEMRKNIFSRLSKIIE